MPTIPDHVTRSRLAHHAALCALTPLTVRHKGNGLALWRKLRRIEADATRAIIAYCNGETTPGFDWEIFSRGITGRVAKVFGAVPVGFFVNTDPRGYALKLDPERGAIIPPGLHQDWGRYGILAPEIN